MTAAFDPGYVLVRQHGAQQRLVLRGAAVEVAMHRPARAQLVAAEYAELRVGIADVDDQNHGKCSPSRRGYHIAEPAPVTHPWPTCRPHSASPT